MRQRTRTRGVACAVAAVLLLGCAAVPASGATRPSQGCTELYVNGKLTKICWDTLTGGSSGGQGCGKGLTDCAPAPGCDPQKASCNPA